MLLSIIAVSADNDIEISAGAYWKQLPETIVYEATIALNYQTSWEEDRLSLKDLHEKSTCKNRASEECIITYHMGELSKSFTQEFQLLNDNWNAGAMKFSDQQAERKRRALDFIGSGLSWCCGVATIEKLKLIDESEKHVNQRIQRLSKGLLGTVKNINQNSKHFKEYEESVASAFKETESRMKFVEKYARELEERIGKSADKQEVLALTTLYGQYANLKRLVLLTRSLRRHAVVNSCKHHKIPVDIIHPQVLGKDLKKLLGEIRSSGQRLAIDVTETWKYYELPICDCSFTEQKLFIHIKIPVIQGNNNWQLYELITTPFAWFNETCFIPHQPLYMAVSMTEKSKDKIRQISGAGLHQCKPYNNKLCFVPRFSGDIFQGPQCAKMLYEGNTVEKLSHYCPMQCHSATSMIITEADEEVYILTHPTSDLMISCSENDTTQINTKHFQQGAIKIHLPCNCHLHSLQSIIIPKRFPCPDVFMPSEAKILHIIPATWSTLKSFVLNPKLSQNPPTYKNLTECLNSNWSLHIPHLNITSTDTTLNYFEDSINSHFQTIFSYNDDYSIHKESIFLIWNIILSIIVVYLFFNHNRYAAVATVIPGVRAQGPSSNVAHVTIFGILCGSLAAFLLFFMTYCIYRFFFQPEKNKKVKNENQSKNEFKLECSSEDIEMSCILENNLTMRCSLRPHENKSLLSLGHKLLADIECIEIK